MKRIRKAFIVLLLLAVLSACGNAGTEGNVMGDTAAADSSVEESVEETAETPDTEEKTPQETAVPEEPEEGEGAENEDEEEEESMEAGRDKLLYMGQASIRITTAEGKVIYIDPYVGSGYEPAADLILVTHSHYDHNGVDRVANRNPDCRIITWKEALEGGEHQTFDLGFAAVEAVEAGYNRWHSVKECVGYIVTLSDGISVYVTGDTSKTEQMHELADQKIDYAFYCCDGIFNMDLDEAAECAALVGAGHDVPYHVLAQSGVYFDRSRAEQFDSPNLLVIDEGEEIELEGTGPEEGPESEDA